MLKFFPKMLKLRGAPNGTTKSLNSQTSIYTVKKFSKPVLHPNVKFIIMEREVAVAKVFVFLIISYILIKVKSPTQTIAYENLWFRSRRTDKLSKRERERDWFCNRETRGMRESVNPVAAAVFLFLSFLFCITAPVYWTIEVSGCSKNFAYAGVRLGDCVDQFEFRETG